MLIFVIFVRAGILFDDAFSLWVSLKDLKNWVVDLWELRCTRLTGQLGLLDSLNGTKLCANITETDTFASSVTGENCKAN